MGLTFLYVILGRTVIDAIPADPDYQETGRDHGPNTHVILSLSRLIQSLSSQFDTRTNIVSEFTPTPFNMEISDLMSSWTFGSLEWE